MRIRGEKEGLFEVGQSVMRVASSRATLPVLGGVRIVASKEGVEFAATDLEMFVSVDGDFVVEEEGSVAVPGRLLGDILRSLPDGRVSIVGTGAEVRIESGSAEFALSAFPVTDFPEIPQVSVEEVTRAQGSELAKALRQVVRAAGTDEARPVLTGVLWVAEDGLLRLVATDSYRLAIREVAIKEGPTEGMAVVPGRALAEFGRHLAGIGDGQAEVRLGDSQAQFGAGKTMLVTRLIEGEFPNYRKLIPEGYHNRLTVNRDALKETVDRVGLIAQANTPIKLHLGSELKVTAVESGVGEASETVPDADYQGEEMVIGFNPRFLGDGLEGAETEKVVLEVGDPTKPGLVKGEDREDFLYLVMPVRLTR
ncbi:MAG: DNA polymerase III subunit beta [Acidimicrobiia bacterium]